MRRISGIIFQAIYRCYVAGMELRCILQKREPRVCIHYVLGGQTEKGHGKKKHLCRFGVKAEKRKYSHPVLEKNITL